MELTKVKLLIKIKDMKQYIKPTTVVATIKMKSYMQTLSTSSKSANPELEMDTKSRDVWSEGYW